MALASWRRGALNVLPGWHPVVVHFPLALTVTAALCFLPARWLKPRAAEVLAIAGTVNLCIAAAAALLALATGLGAVLDLQVGEAAHRAISAHSKWALFSTVGLILLAVWRGAGTAPGARPSPVFLVMMIGLAAALIWTGLQGHENVYAFGVGVSR